MAKKIGLCLTGGGARGAYQIGAIKALDTLGIFKNIKAFSGTSIGAANVAVVASNSIHAAEEVWLNMPDNNIPKIEDDEEKKRLRLPDFKRGIYSMHIFESVIKESVKFDALQKKEVYVTVSQGGEFEGGFKELFKSGFSHYIKKDSQVRYMPLHEMDALEAHQSIIASSSIPLFFSPVEINNHNCYDGGVFDNIPVTPLIENGCDEIILIHLQKGGTRFFSNQKYEGVIIHEIKHAGKDLGKVLKFSQAQTKRLLKLGYEETIAYFEHYKKDKT